MNWQEDQYVSPPCALGELAEQLRQSPNEGIT